MLVCSRSLRSLLFGGEEEVCAKNKFMIRDSTQRFLRDSRVSAHRIGRAPISKRESNSRKQSALAHVDVASLRKASVKMEDARDDGGKVTQIRFCLSRKEEDGEGTQS